MLFLPLTVPHSERGDLMSLSASYRYMDLGKLFNLSRLQFLICKMGVLITPT